MIGKIKLIVRLITLVIGLYLGFEIVKETWPILPIMAGAFATIGATLWAWDGML